MNHIPSTHYVSKLKVNVVTELWNTLSSRKIKSAVACRKPAYQCGTALNQTCEINQFCFLCWTNSSSVYQRCPVSLLTPPVSSAPPLFPNMLCIEVENLLREETALTPRQTVFRQETSFFSFLHVGLKILNYTREFKMQWHRAGLLLSCEGGRRDSTDENTVKEHVEYEIINVNGRKIKNTKRQNRI